MELYFDDKGSPKVDSNHTCLAVINLNSVLKKDDDFYPQMFLKECKYNEKLGIFIGNILLLMSLTKNRRF